MSTSTPSGSFADQHPISTEADVKRAIQAAKTPADKKHTHQRANAIGHGHLIPSHWKNTDGSLRDEN